MKEPILARHFGDIVGIKHIVTNVDDCAAYAVQGVVPQLVVTPGSITELAEVMAVAHQTGAVVVPWGGGTEQAYGQPPDHIDIIVCTSRLDHVIEYEPHDLTISVEAGITLGALDDLLSQHGQMLPLDVPLPRQATIGGLLATAMDGPRRLGYGTSRDLLIGISVVETTGRISKAGGMVVKNVSGFDMMKLYLGSFGTLAIIASANFKLIPRPRAAATVVCAFDALPASIALADAIHGSQLVPAAVEFILTTDDTSQQFPFGVPHLVVCAEGLPAAVERHIRDVTQLAQSLGARTVDVVRDADHTALWTQINDLPQTANVASNELVLRLTCLPSEVGPALIAVESLHGDGLHMLIVAHALSGVAYLRFRSEDPSQLVAAYTALGSLLGRLASSARLIALAGATVLITGFNSIGDAPEGVEVMKHIKAEFDPSGNLNPGRMIGIIS